MAGHWRLPLCIAIVLALLGCSASTAQPSIVIDAPLDGAVLLDPSIDATGTASGSDGTWFQGGAAEFRRGTMVNVSLDDLGRVVLRERVADDFSDGKLDPSQWSLESVGGVTAVEEDGGLHVKGTSTTGGAPWNGCAWVWTVARGFRYIEAKVTAFSGSGSGYTAGIVLWKDDRNFIGIGLQVEPDVYGQGVHLCVSTKSPSTSYYVSKGDTTAAPHTYAISNLDGRVALFQDGVEYANESMSMTDAKVVIKPAARERGDTTDSVWDDVWSDYFTQGTLISSVFDGGVDSLNVRRVDWNASEPRGTSVRLELRSSSTKDMQSSTPWVHVENGKSPGRGAMRRYVQYRAVLTTTELFTTPSLSDVSLNYEKPVTKVEVSIDGRASWTTASGTVSWRSSLVLPEGSTTIWARATDCMGDTAETSVKVIADTAPPTGSVLINGGDVFTNTTEVSLTLNASARGGMARMRIAQDPSMALSAWTDYSERLPWTLVAGDGSKTVYAMFMDVHGKQSAIVNDSIILDTLPPMGNISINGGADVTNSTAVTLKFDVYDASGVVQVLVSEDPMFENAQWVAFRETMGHTLSTGDGPKTVYARFKDRLGHVSGHTDATILLDTGPPSSTISAVLAAPSPRDVLVEWEGADALTGVRHYDVQVREGYGPWIELASRTQTNTSAFRGEWGMTYYFRVRATDGVGNQAAFPEDEADFAKVSIPERRRVVAGDDILLPLVVIVVILVAAIYAVWRSRQEAPGSSQAARPPDIDVPGRGPNGPNKKP